MEFFSSEGSDTSIPIPIVALRNVDDSYPPQKKSFMMLKYMHDHYLDKYEWFMRADDDVYIKSEKLESFLRSLNSSEAIFLGQTGMGARDELGKLALEPGENFCMGGPGVIMSREVLRRMVPHIRECLQEMYTTHEDVEVGRCVRRFAKVQCVWSYEVNCFLFLYFSLSAFRRRLELASCCLRVGVGTLEVCRKTFEADEGVIYISSCEVTLIILRGFHLFIRAVCKWLYCCLESVAVKVGE